MVGGDGDAGARQERASERAGSLVALPAAPRLLGHADT
jgi:hypothetical protein